MAELPSSSVSESLRDKSFQDADEEKDEPQCEEKVITSGEDVSDILVNEHDDGDQALTFRSILLGTVFAGLGAALSQIYQFKPVSVTVSTVFLLLITYFAGVLWDKVMPKQSIVQNTRFMALGPILNFITPPEFKLKEHVVASLVASTASAASPAVMNFAVQRLYYDTKVNSATAVLAIFSTACFGYGLVGLLRPITVYPSEMVYWSNLPAVNVFQAFHLDPAGNKKRVKLFWTAFTVMFVYEILPAYIFPLLHGISIFCLASQKASSNIVNIFTNVFGGTDSNEGLGLFSINLDWQYIGSWYMSVPIIQQANSWIGYVVCYIAITAIYYTNTWNSLAFPMLSTSIFSSNGSVYNQAAVFGPKFQLNETALQEIGLPALTGSNAWSNLTANLAIGGLIAHTGLFWGPEVIKSLLLSRKCDGKLDRHYKAMRDNYAEAPWWWYMILLVLSFFAGLIVVLIGETTLPVRSYIVALILGSFIAPFSNLLWGRIGSSVTTTQLMKMVAGALDPGRPVANLYFSMWSHNIVSTSINLAGDLKMGQYLKIPPRVMFFTQIWGTLVGALVNYVVMISVVDNQREILLKPRGNNIWSGHALQSLNSGAVTWSLSKQLYGPNGPYLVIPLGLVIGMVPTFIQWLIYKRWRKIGPVQVDSILFPVIIFYSASLSAGVNSYILSSVGVGIFSQLWLRKKRPTWFKNFNYVLGGAMDGGTQVMIFVLSFAAFGASGVGHPFPAWKGNPKVGNTDYCNGNGALK